MKISFIFFLLSYLALSCAPANKLHHNNDQVKILEGLYIERYKYGFDNTVNDNGYWFYSRGIVTDKGWLALAGAIGNFDNVFNCEEYRKLIDSIKVNMNPKGLAFRNNNPDEYYLDTLNKELYYLVAVKGEFVFLDAPFCKRDKKALSNISIKPPCKLNPLPINQYPILLPINFLKITPSSLLDINSSAGIVHLSKVRGDTLKFWPCY